jgi:hypothetical protein
MDLNEISSADGMWMEVAKIAFNGYNISDAEPSNFTKKGINFLKYKDM